ncbi:TnsA endonuclease N-terminal domain-containing protein (plasmid) [Chromobacterium amazonense]|uniref:TnsA endonuclease N-terminal domain-containing protein n=1 Tax=Chromobacterium amazonense TaxID=1382803 RepID=UPI00237DAEB2|nr:TnsA endonuclease N-terminal domain-containing protein [Chromobacterium amazonense]MDE1712705.1 TnsA endonuclease N-terminal domain-containing protein [Chromobacterium amazonense]
MLTPSVRKIHNKNSRKVISSVYVNQMHGHVSCESQLEHRWLLQLTSNPSIAQIRSQPMKVDYQFDGEWHTYTPDFLVAWKDENKIPTIYEVKPAIQAKKYQEKFQAIKQELAKKGYEFVVVSEDLINTQPLNRNLKKLKHYSSCFVHLNERLAIYGALPKYATCSIEQLCSNFSDKRATLCAIYKLLWDGDLTFNPNEALNLQSLVWVGQGGLR